MPLTRRESGLNLREAALRGAAEWKGLNMPQMFDWIFFAIVLLPMAYITWDWLKNR